MNEELRNNDLIHDKVTVITVVYNGVSSIERTIQSVLGQSYPNLEYIVIDGGSTDGTVEVIKRYGEKIDFWLSEPDIGIYDAMNKGIRHSNGKWLNFMNAGDKFVSNNVLSDIPFTELSEYPLIYGNKIQDGNVIPPLPVNSLETGVIHANHQSMFFNKSILKDELYYDLKYLIYADYELVNRIYLKYPGMMKYLNMEVADYEGGGVSAMPSYQKRKDKYRIVYKHYGFIGFVKTIANRFIK